MIKPLDDSPSPEVAAQTQVVPRVLLVDDERSILNALKRLLRREGYELFTACLLYTSPSPRDQRGSRMPSSA